MKDDEEKGRNNMVGNNPKKLNETFRKEPQKKRQQVVKDRLIHMHHQVRYQ